MRKFSETKMLKKMLSWILIATFVVSAIGMHPGQAETVEAEATSDSSVPTVESLGWDVQNTAGITIENQASSGVKFTAAADTYYYAGISTQISGARYKLSDGFRLEFTDFESADDNYSVAVMLGVDSKRWTGKMFYDCPGYSFIYGHDGSFAIVKTVSGGTLAQNSRTDVAHTTGLTVLSEIDTMSLYIKYISNDDGTEDWKVIVNNGEYEYTIKDIKGNNTEFASAGWLNSCHVNVSMFSDFTATDDNALSGIDYLSKRSAATSFVLSKCYYADATGSNTATDLEKYFKIPYVPVESVVLNKTTATIEQAENVQLSATANPTGATDGTIKWISDNESVATVDQNGSVTGIASGQTVVRARTDYGIEAICNIVVYETGSMPSCIPTVKSLGWGVQNTAGITIENQASSGVKFTAAADTYYYAGISTQISGARYKLSDGFRLEFTDFESVDDNYSVAVMLGVDSKRWTGKMFYDCPGYSFIYGHDGSFAIVKTVSGGNLAQSSRTDVAHTTGLTVLSEIDTMSLYIKYISNDDGTEDWKVIVNNGEYEYTIKDIKGNNTEFASAGWLNSCHVNVSMFSDFTATDDNALSGIDYLSKRSAATSFVLSKCYYADATGSNTKTTLAKYFSIPYIPVESVTLNKTIANIEKTGCVQLSADVTPETATDAGIIWTSSNNRIATVDQNGVVTGLVSGKAVITATTAYGKSVECEVTVYEAKIMTGYGQVLINAGEKLPVNDYAYSQDADHDGVYITGWLLNGEAVTDLTYYSNNAGKYTAEYINLDMLHIHAQKNNEIDNVYRFIGSVDAPTEYKESGFIIAKTQDAKLDTEGVYNWYTTDTYYTGIVVGENRIVAGDAGLFDASIYGEDIANNKLFIRAVKFSSGVSEENPYYVRAYVKLSDGTVVYGKTITFMGDVHFE